MRIKLLSVISLVSFTAFAQKIDVEYKTMAADPEAQRSKEISDMELSPDQKTLAIGQAQGPVLIWDVSTGKFLKRIEVEGYTFGPRIEFAQNGKYLLLQKGFVIDNNLNKDRQSKVEILDIESGKILFNSPKVHDAVISYDCKYILTLSGNNVDIFDIASGNLQRTIIVEDATNAVAISNDGKTVAVSHKLRKDDIADIPSIRDDKKTIKTVLKFREGVSFYDFTSGKRLKTCSDIFDVVYTLRYTADGNRILVYNAANTRLQAEAGGSQGGRQGYVSQINASTGEVMRTIVSSMVTEPDFKESADNKYLGVSSIDFNPSLVPTVIIYDMEMGDVLYKFEVNIRLWKDWAGNPASFIFLPDNKTIWLNSGGKLAIWIPTK